MTDTQTMETVESLTARLKVEFSHYVILHAKTSPERVVEFFLDEFLGADEYTVQALTASLRAGKFWKASQVAELLIEAYGALQQGQEFVSEEDRVHDAVEALRAEVNGTEFLDEHIKVIPVGFEPERIIEFEHVETVLRTEGELVMVLNGEENPFAGLDSEQTFGAKEAAALMGRSYGYMKDHGTDLNGTKTTRGAWQFTAAALAAAWPTHKG